MPKRVRTPAMKRLSAASQALVDAIGEEEARVSLSRASRALVAAVADIIDSGVDPDDPDDAREKAEKKLARALALYGERVARMVKEL